MLLFSFFLFRSNNEDGKVHFCFGLCATMISVCMCVICGQQCVAPLPYSANSSCRSTLVNQRGSGTKLVVMLLYFIYPCGG